MKGKLLRLRRESAAAGSSVAASAVDSDAGDELGDEALIAACAVGDAAALGAIYDRHSRLVFRFVSRVAGGPASDVEDLVQQTFLEVWRSAARFCGRGSAKSWILGVAANLARHFVRGEIRRRIALADPAASWSARADGPERTAERRQLLDRLGGALAELPHDLRVAFVMCDVEEIAGVDAARALGVREGTMWRRLHQARRALRALLAGEAS